MRCLDRSCPAGTYPFIPSLYIENRNLFSYKELVAGVKQVGAEPSL